MPKHVFKDSDNIKFELLPKGDYIVEVVGVEFGIQKPGTETAGSDIMKIKVKVDGKPNQWEERFIFYKSCEWRIDTFVKCMNFLVNGKPPVKGQEIDYTEESLMGLRGWVTIGVREQKKTVNNITETTLYNEVLVWLTDKPKLARADVF